MKNELEELLNFSILIFQEEKDSQNYSLRHLYEKYPDVFSHNIDLCFADYDHQIPLQQQFFLYGEIRILAYPYKTNSNEQIQLAVSYLFRL